MEIKEKLVALRKEKGLTQLAVAEKLDVSRQAISRWESGMALPSTDNLRCLSSLYEVPIDYLLKEDSKRKSDSDNEPAPDKIRHKNKKTVALIAAALVGVLAIGILCYFLTRHNEKYIFIEVTPEDEDHLVASVQPVTKEEYERLSQEVVKLQEEGNRVATMDLIQNEKVFDGFMTLQAKAAKISTSRYKISGTYEWTTRPQGFGTIFKGLRQDIFTIAPDAHGRFSNSTMYAIRKVDWARTVTDAQGVHHMTYGNNNKDFNGANSMTFRDGGGFGIDIPIEYSSTGDGYSYRNYNGYIGGEMLISEDNLRATLKICVDYAKNTKRIGSISSISVSIPPSLSISFSSGGDKYTVQESALMFHVPDFRKVS